MAEKGWIPVRPLLGDNIPIAVTEASSHFCRHGLTFISAVDGQFGPSEFNQVVRFPSVGTAAAPYFRNNLPMHSFIPRLAQNIASAVTQATAKNGSGTEVELGSALNQIIALLKQARQKQRWIFLVGNGGSSSIADHTANDLRRNGMRALSLSSPTALTSIANDNGYENVFAKQVQSLASDGDILIAISSSGKSTNVCQAAYRMKERGGTVITLSGMTFGNQLSLAGDLNVFVSQQEYCVVEMSHHIICHAISDALAETIVQ